MRRFFVTLSAGLALLVSFDAARAAETGGHAAACKPARQADVANLAFLTNGVNNNGATSALAVCGMVRLQSSNLTTLTAEYIDNSDTAQLTCVARLWGWNNKSILWAQTKTSGIPTKGANTFTWTLPANVFGYLDLQCGIPAKVGTSMSVLRGFRLQ
jgi:hypothetical protein